MLSIHLKSYQYLKNGQEIVSTMLFLVKRLALDLENNLSYYPAPPEITNPRTATIEAVDQYMIRVTIADFGDTGEPAVVFHPKADTAGPCI